MSFLINCCCTPDVLVFPQKNNSQFNYLDDYNFIENNQDQLDDVIDLILQIEETENVEINFQVPTKKIYSTWRSIINTIYSVAT